MKVIMTREELKELKGECSHDYIPIIDWKEHKLVYVHHDRIIPIEIKEIEEAEERMRRECLKLKSKLKPGESLIGCDEFIE